MDETNRNISELICAEDLENETLAQDERETGELFQFHSDQVDCWGPWTTSHSLILFLKHIHWHKSYWLAASQASIQSL